VRARPRYVVHEIVRQRKPALVRQDPVEERVSGDSVRVVQS